jgi:hypothetical protein
MSRIDDVITAIPIMTVSKRALWSTNAGRVIAKGPHCNLAYAEALRLPGAIATHESARPLQGNMIATSGLDGDRLVARITRIKTGMFIVRRHGATLLHSFFALPAARAAAAEAVFGRAADAPAALP